MPNWTHDFYSQPGYKQKIADAQHRRQSKRTAKQRELVNARIALSYRRSHAKNLFDLQSYTGRRDAKKWIAVAEERLQKALNLLSESA